ncbi:hypothetical protein D3C85_1264410 [compost metagenome]
MNTATAENGNSLPVSFLTLIANFISSFPTGDFFWALLILVLIDSGTRTDSNSFSFEMRLMWEAEANFPSMSLSRKIGREKRANESNPFR